MELLRRKGRDIVNESNEKIMLRGTCTGGWMNMENFINGYPGTETNLRVLMRQGLGEELGNFFFEEMLDRFLDEEDYRFIAGSGANCVRLDLNYRHFEDDENPFVYKEEGFRRLDRALDLCEKHNLYAILDMHAVQGWQNSHWHSDNIWGVSLFWRDKLYQDRFYALWQEIARRYADRNVVAGYELMNEPSSNTAIGDFPFNFYENFRSDSERFNRVNRTAVEKIREVDKRHIIFIEGDNYGHVFKGMEEPFDDNTVYSSHDYVVSGFGPGKYPGPYEQLRNDQIEDAGEWDYDKQVSHILETEGWKFAQKHNVPLWVGEFGSQYNTGEEDMAYRLKSMDDQLKAYNELGIHWTTWTYKDCGVMGWVTLSPESRYRKIIEPVQRMKAVLAAENFTGWRAPSPGKKMVTEMAGHLEEVLQNPEISHETNIRCLSNAVLTGYVATLLQPEYVNLFKGYGREELRGILGAFAFGECVVNEGYLEVLKRRIR
ncbi:glycoside hydrolase family 5 protein [Anaerotalea alkaliphila]|uniref:Glycoside hydrolase family 5 protein n=1 Tax=Anaerotalea alkaliphila TaxID=2662126 RepID=A0A7X5HXD4_9FIRM|nr:cellulase family glycosylhydrolase [Anaerotalea alkaliphila]NDL68405.1 glycoside hydrolase family 5 protein [Anaerotalea alkaliphila]